MSTGTCRVACIHKPQRVITGHGCVASSNEFRTGCVSGQRHFGSRQSAVGSRQRRLCRSWQRRLRRSFQFSVGSRQQSQKAGPAVPELAVGSWQEPLRGSWQGRRSRSFQLSVGSWRKSEETTVVGADLVPLGDGRRSRSRQPSVFSS